MSDLVIDWSDPCAALAEISKAYYDVLTGNQAIKVNYEQRDVWYNKANLPDLLREMRRLEPLCAAKNGVTLPRTRRALVGGFKCGC
jgi:hypothetical protein